MNIENLVINRIVRGTLFDKSTGEVLVSIDQITDATLECSGEQVYTNDAMGQRIAAFDRGKDATISGTNALLNFGLMAAQLGSEKEIASSSKKITVPTFELLEVTDSSGSKIATLTNEPKEGTLKYVYSVNPDKTRKEKYALGTSATANEFAIAGKQISLPTGAGFNTGDLIAVWYDREVEDGMLITNSTTKFAKGGRFVLEVLACDVCDINTEYYAYIIFNNAKMDNNVSITLSNETTQPFTINALQDYCSANNELFKIVVAA